MKPVIMADDGEFLTPVGVNPQMIAASAWEGFKDGGDVAALAAIRAQIEVDDDAPIELGAERNSEVPTPAIL